MSRAFSANTCATKKSIRCSDAIRRLSSLPAHNLKLRDRGELAVGNFADIVVFDPATIADHATFDKPQQFATGVRDVFVNGVQVLKNGEHTGATPGQVVRGPGWSGWHDTAAPLGGIDGDRDGADGGRMTAKSSDVLVLGGGVIGLACALYLLRAGRSVTVIEMGKVGAAASHGNCGTITPSHCMPLAVPGVIGQALRWMMKPDAPFRIAPRLDFGLFEWLLSFAHRCNWNDAKRVTAVKSELLQLSRKLLEDLIRGERLDCEFETIGTMNVFRDAKTLEKSHWLPATAERQRHRDGNARRRADARARTGAQRQYRRRAFLSGRCASASESLRGGTRARGAREGRRHPRIDQGDAAFVSTAIASTPSQPNTAISARATSCSRSARGVRWSASSSICASRSSRAKAIRSPTRDRRSRPSFR